MSSQKVGAQAFDVLGHVSINVTGAGIAPAIVKNWDSNKDGNNTATSAPTSFDIDIPQGPGRLIQVLAVYGSSTGKGQMQFYYGDITQDLTASSQSVTVTVSSLGQGTPIVSGRVSGRYLTAPNMGPTSTVDMLFNPPSGKPPMIISNGGIVAGWFQFFALQGAPLSYRLRDGTILFGGPVDLSSPVFNPSSSVLKVSIPLHYQSEYMNNTQVSVLEDPSVNVLGFFGDAVNVGSKVVCRETTGSFTNYKMSNDNSVALTLADNTAAPANLFTALLQSIYTQGGVGIAGAAPCDNAGNATLATNYFINNLYFNAGMLDSNGGDGFNGFRLPFVLNANGGIVSSAPVDANTVAVKGTLLPQVPLTMDKLVAFKKAGQRDTNSDTAPCMDLVNQGFVPAGEGVLNAATPRVWGMNLPYSATDQSAGAVFALCPVKNGVMWETGFWLRGDNFNSSTGGGMMGGGPPDHVNISFQDNLTTFGVNACVPIRFNIVDVNNSGANVTTGIPYAINLGTAVVGLYTDFACTSPMSTSGNFTGGSLMMAYAKITATPGVNGSISITTSSLPRVNPASPSNSASIAATKIAFVDQDTGNTLTTLSTYKCHRILVQAQDSTGKPVQISSGQYFGFTEGSLISYYGYGTDSACAMTPTSGTYTVSTATTNIPASVIPLAGLTSLSGQIYSTPLNLSNTVISGGSIVAAVTAVGVDIAPLMPGPGGSAPFNATDIYVPINQCIPMEFYARGGSVGLRGQFSNISGATFSPNSFPSIQSNMAILNGSNACSSGLTTMSTNTYYLAGDYRKVFYIKNSTAGNATLSVLDTGSNVQKTVTIHFQ
jgi:hypothetical protein